MDRYLGMLGSMHKCSIFLYDADFPEVTGEREAIGNKVKQGIGRCRCVELGTAIATAPITFLQQSNMMN